MKKNQNTAVEENVVIETPKAETTAATIETPKVKSTPVMERQYVLVANPSITPKGKQRQIVLKALNSTTDPQTIEQITKFATAEGLQAVGGIGPSCRYHIHHLVKLGIAKIVNPSTTVADPTIAEAEVA